MSIIDKLHNIFLKRSSSAYTISTVAVLSIAVLTVVVMLYFDIVFVNDSVSSLLRTFATVQLTTLAIIFSLTIAGIQFASGQLPFQVSHTYFQTPIFKLTIIGLAGGAILQLITDAILLLLEPVLGSLGKILWLSVVFSIGLYSVCLLVIYILVFPALMSVQSLLRHFKEIESLEDGVDAAVTSFRNSIREANVHKGEKVADALQGFIEELVDAGISSPFRASHQTLSQLLTRKLPKIVEEVNKKSEFHAMIQECYRVAISRGVVTGSVDVLQDCRKGIIYSCGKFDSPNGDWLGYWRSFNEAVENLESDFGSDTSMEVIASVANSQQELFTQDELMVTSYGYFTECSGLLIGTYWQLYEILVSNFDEQTPPVVKANNNDDITMRNDREPPIEQIQRSLAESLQAVYNRFLEFDPNENEVNPVAPPLQKICRDVFRQWGEEATVPMLVLYFEAAYLYSELPQLSGAQWRKEYETFDNKDINSNNPLGILDWYDERSFELQYLTFEPQAGAKPQQDYEDWLRDFLNDID